MALDECIREMEQRKQKARAQGDPGKSENSTRRGA
jgi:hypothetical protein